MTYEKQTYFPGEAGGTPATPTRLNHSEQGIADAHAYLWRGRPSTLEVVGNSYAAGGGQPVPRARWSSILATQLHAIEHNMARNGTSLYRDALGGDHGGWVMSLVRKKPLKADGSIRTSAPYLASSGLVALTRGLNDLGNLGEANIEPFLLALEAEISRYRTAAHFGHDHASVAKSANWSTGNYNLASDGTHAFTGTDGSTITISVPVDFPGGAVAIGAVVGGDDLFSGTFDVAVDGGAPDTWDMRSGAALAGSYYTGVVYRVTGLASGAHTIVLTAHPESGSQFVDFNYWQIEAPEPPLILVDNIARIPTPDPNTGDAAVTSTNAAIANVVAGFDDRVVVCDIDAVLDKRVDRFAADGQHPNELGHSLIANEKLLLVLKHMPRSWSMPKLPSLWHIIGDLNVPGFQNNWSDANQAGYGPIGYRKDAEGVVHLRGLINNGTINTTAFTLPEEYRPATNRIFSVCAHNGSARVFGCVAVNSDGTVQILSPSQTGSGRWTALDNINFVAL